VADSSPSVREVLARDHLLQLALLLDKQFLEGSGTAPNMRGIRNLTGVSTTSLGANGATPTLDNFADAVQRIQVANAGARLGWIMHSRTLGTVRKIKDGQSRYQLAPDPSQDAPQRLFGIPIHVSNQISITETQGTSSDASWVALVDFSQVAIAEWQTISLQYSSDFKFDADQLAVRTTARYDIQPLQASAAGVELITGVRP
jgi:HK97 family phage major capsid protein